MRLEAIRERLGYQPILLGLTALLAGSALMGANEATRDSIAAAEARDLQNSLLQVLPQELAENDLIKDVIDLPDGKGGKTKVHVARKQGAVTAAVFQTAERGYAADILVLMAVDREGKVLGVRVLKHSETPGLGDKIEIGKSQWIDSFKGRSIGDPPPERWSVKKDGGAFDQMAGATITPRAVVKAVKDGLDFFDAHRKDILG